MENQLIGKIKIKYLPKRLNNTTPETSKKAQQKVQGCTERKCLKVSYLIKYNFWLQKISHLYILK